MLWTRNYAVVMAAGIAFLLLGLIGATAVTGVLPQELMKYNPHASPLVESTAYAAAAKKAECRVCGVIAAIRPVQVEREASGASAGSGAASSSKVYRVTVRMDDGTERTVTQSVPAFTVGTRVRVKGVALERG